MIFSKHSIESSMRGISNLRFSFEKIIVEQFVSFRKTSPNFWLGGLRFLVSLSKLREIDCFDAFVFWSGVALSPLFLTLIVVMRPIKKIRVARVSVTYFGQGFLSAENVALQVRHARSQTELDIGLCYISGRDVSQGLLTLFLKEKLVSSPIFGGCFYLIHWLGIERTFGLPSMPFGSERDFDGLFDSYPSEFRNFLELPNIVDILESNRVFCVYCREDHYRNSEHNSNYRGLADHYLSVLKEIKIPDEHIFIGLGGLDCPEFDDLADNAVSLTQLTGIPDTKRLVSVVDACELFISFAGGGVSSLPLVLRKKFLCIDFDPLTFFSGYENCFTRFAEYGGSSFKNDLDVFVGKRLEQLRDREKAMGPELISAEELSSILSPALRNADFSPHEWPMASNERVNAFEKALIRRYPRFDKWHSAAGMSKILL